jgi:hypothetical protein
MARNRAGQAAVLMVLSPVCAEYLAGYDSSTGDVVELLVGLLFFIPLYGFAAILIREGSRRAKLGWPGIVSFSAAFGLLQAGVIDQSIFSEGYRELESWSEMTSGTLLPSIGISAYTALLFVGGHMIFSFCGPIALVESFRPETREQPWMGYFGLFVCSLLYVLVATLVLLDHLTTESSHASKNQVAGTSLVVVLLLVAPFFVGKSVTSEGQTHHRFRPLINVVVGLIGGSSLVLIPPTWLGTVVSGTILLSITLWLARSGWSCGETAAIASGLLLSRAAWAFTYFPLFGDIPPFEKYAHNVVMFTIVLAVSYVAIKRSDT